MNSDATSQSLIQPLIQPGDLVEAMNDQQQDLLLLDARFDLQHPDWGAEGFKLQTISGAQYLDLNTDLSSEWKKGKTGRHPLPSNSQWNALLARLGLITSSGSKIPKTIVIFDQNTSAFAARAWWLFMASGFTKVKVLDGGLEHFIQQLGNKLCHPGDLNLTGRDHHSAPFKSANTLTYREVSFNFELYRSQQQLKEALASKNSIILDARSEERYAGKFEPIDPVAGHIPTALNRDFTANLTTEANGVMRFKDAERLKEEFLAILGDSKHPFISYCGSGVTACHNILAAVIAGLPTPLLYPGSWSEWITNKENPIETDQP